MLFDDYLTALLHYIAVIKRPVEEMHWQIKEQQQKHLETENITLQGLHTGRTVQSSESCRAKCVRERDTSLQQSILMESQLQDALW